MKTLLIVVCLLLPGCVIPEVIYLDRAYIPHGHYTPPVNIVDPLEQHIGGMSFICRSAINRGDSGGAFIFCR